MKNDKIGLITLFCVLVGVSVFLMFFSFVLGLTTLVISCGSLSLLLFVYYFLAPKNIFFTFVQEGTAKAVVRGGKFRKALIQWEKSTLDKNWDVASGREHHLFGGLRLYGFWPLDQIYKYKFEWTGLEPDGITPRPHAPEILDNIFLKQYVYFAKVEKAEDAKRLPLNVCFVLTIQIVNPYKALFKVHKWLAVTFGRITPEIRNVIAQEKYEDLIKDLGNVANRVRANITGGGVTNVVNVDQKKKEDILKTLKKDYGVDVLAIKILTIDPPEELRETTLLEFKADQEKKQIEIRAEAEKIKLTKEGEGEGQRRKAIADGEEYSIDRISAAQARRFKQFQKVDPNLGALALDTARQITPNKIILIGKDLGDAAKNLGNLAPWYPKKPGDSKPS
jgi:regulator of protease activity HflC (stomatin/prohibitin superfamily)